MIVYYADHHVVELPPGHRFPMAKYAQLRQALIDRGVVAASDMREAPLATRADLVRVHDADYVDAFIAGRVPDKMMRDIGLPWSRALVDRTLSSVGGTVCAIGEARRSGVGANLAGGTHHAHRARGAGFCVFNDLAVAAGYALANGVRSVLIFDADVHQGDGTATIFADHARIHTVSIHARSNFPFHKATSDADIELADHTGDDDYLRIVRASFSEQLARTAPELVLYQAGVDPLREDALGRLSVSVDGLYERDRFVLHAAKSAGVPIVTTLGGGYAKPIELSIEAHVGTYRAIRDVFG